MAPRTSTRPSRSFHAAVAAAWIWSKLLPVTSRSRFLRAWSTERNDVARRIVTSRVVERSKVAEVAADAVGARSKAPDTNIRLRPADKPLPLSTQPVNVPSVPMVKVPLWKTRLPVDCPAGKVNRMIPAWSVGDISAVRPFCSVTR